MSREIETLALELVPADGGAVVGRPCQKLPHQSLPNQTVSLSISYSYFGLAFRPSCQRGTTVYVGGFSCYETLVPQKAFELPK